MMAQTILDAMSSMDAPATAWDILSTMGVEATAENRALLSCKLRTLASSGCVRTRGTERHSHCILWEVIQ